MKTILTCTAIPAVFFAVDPFSFSAISSAE